VTQQAIQASQVIVITLANGKTESIGSVYNYTVRYTLQTTAVYCSFFVTLSVLHTPTGRWGSCRSNYVGAAARIIFGTRNSNLLKM